MSPPQESSLASHRSVGLFGIGIDAYWPRFEGYD
jgi:hypothetical protein